MPTQVRCERNSWRACAWAARSRQPRTTSPAVAPRGRLGAGALSLWAALYVVLCLVLIGLAIAFGQLFWLGAACALVLASAAGYVYFIGSMWWITGAGEPVLLVQDGVMHGRIRPVAKGAAARIDLTDSWDFVIPAAEVKNVRLSGPERRPSRRTILIELPDTTSTKLVTDPASAWYARRWLAHAGTPAAWPVGRMLRRPGRRERLHQLLVDLQACTVDR